MTEVRVSTLANGLRIASDPVTTLETVSVGIWIDVGARDEPPELNGVSHLLEHMVFKGTERRSARAIAEEIEAVGGHLNAHTAREYTAFYAKVLKDDLALAVDVLADIVQHAVLDAEELDRERTVIIQEILQAHDTPDDIVFDHFQETAFPGQSIGRSVLGSIDNLRSIEHGAVVDYMRRHYRAGAMVLAAAGNVDHEALEALAASTLAGLPAGDGWVRDLPRYVGGDRREERDLEQLHIVLGFEGVSFRHADFYAVSVLSTLLGGGMSSRLFQEVRENRGLVYSIYTFPTSFADGGIFGIYAGAGEREAEEVVPLICAETMKVADDVGEEEVARARAQLKASILMSLESTSARCEQLARQLIVFGRPLPVAEIVASIDAVDLATVARVARELAAVRPTVTAMGPIGRLEAYDRIAARLTR
jgi:predicted Zn-dependent peptidase